VEDLSVRQTYAGYFLVQAIAGSGFWVLLWTRPGVRGGFEMLAAERAVTSSFLLADLVLGIVGSFVVAGAVLARRPWSGGLALFVAGGIVYATLYILFWVVATGEGAMMLGIMVPTALMSTYVAVQIQRSVR
jgi:hypothetical protein